MIFARKIFSRIYLFIYLGLGWQVPYLISPHLSPRLLRRWIRVVVNDVVVSKCIRSAQLRKAALNVLLVGLVLEDDWTKLVKKRARLMHSK